MPDEELLFQLSERILDAVIGATADTQKEGLPRTMALGLGLETCLNLLVHEYGVDEVASMLIKLARMLRKREIPEHGTVLQILGDP